MIANYYLQIKSWIYHRRKNNHSNGQKSNSSIRANSYAESIKFQNYNNFIIVEDINTCQAGIDRLLHKYEFYYYGFNHND